MTEITMKQQSGVVLMISLIMLILLTILGVTALQVTGLQEKMVANFNNKNLAYQASEIALRDAETWLLAEATSPTVTHSRIWDLDVFDSDTDDDDEWWQEDWPEADDFAYADSIPGIATSPNTVIEYRGFIPDTPMIGSPGREFYIITSRGTGGNDQSVVILQSTIARR